MSTTITRPRKTKRGSCVSAMMDLMADYQSRTSEQIAALTGFSPGRVRSHLSATFNYATDRKQHEGTWQTFYRLRKGGH